MKNQYRNLTVPERVDALMQYAKTGLPKKMMRVLETKAKGGKLIIDFTNELSPKTNMEFCVNKRGQEIWVNDEYLVHKPNFHGDNERFFEYVFNNPDTEITKEKLEKDIKRKFTKTFTKMVNGLKFTGEIRKTFFPNVSGKKAVKFRKKVETQDLRDEGVNIELLVKELEVAHERMKK